METKEILKPSNPIPKVKKEETDPVQADLFLNKEEPEAFVPDEGLFVPSINNSEEAQKMRDVDFNTPYEDTNDVPLPKGDTKNNILKNPCE